LQFFATFYARFCRLNSDPNALWRFADRSGREMMSLRAIAAWRTANHGVGAARQRASSITRRQFARAAAGTAVLGSAFSSRLLSPGLAETRASFAPVPIPRGSPLLGGSFHVFAPAPASAGLDPIDAEPITITNFNGFVGLSYTSGMVTQTNTESDETLRLPFISSDMRFMQGEFRGADGRIHHGTFALV
jgi:hypothetical protein